MYSTTYVVCPKSGLSYKITADWNASILSNAIHPDAASGYRTMAKTIRKHLHTIPSTYIAAFCQVWARDNNLLIEPHNKYSAGWITETLAQSKRTDLLALFWACYNSTAGILPAPIKINLDLDDKPSLSSIYNLFYTVATQTTTRLVHMNTRSNYYPTRRAKPKVTRNKLDIVSCIKRAKSLLPRLANALPNSEVPVASARKAAALLPDYLELRTKAKDRIAEILQILMKESLAYDFYSRDCLEYKTMEIVYKHIKETLNPIEMQEVEF